MMMNGCLVALQQSRAGKAVDQTIVACCSDVLDLGRVR